MNILLVELDGAKIIKYTSGEFGYTEDDNGEKTFIKALAICSYDDNEYYLFACDENFNVIGDTIHESIDEAMIFALKYYQKNDINWM